MSEQLFASKGGEITLSRHVGPGGRPMFQITADVSHPGDGYVQLSPGALLELAGFVTGLVINRKFPER